MRRGARERGQSLTDFIIREAEQTPADQRHFSLNPKQWSVFRLQRLLAAPGAWNNGIRKTPIAYRTSINGESSLSL